MFNFGNFSSSKSKSTQSANVFLTQQFSGACNVVCQNTMNNTSIDLINSNVGGDVSITQSCSTNGSCMIGSSMDSVMDVYFKAANSSSAQNAALGVVSAGNIDRSKTISRQSMRMSSYQNTNESCNIGTYNQMNNVTIFAANSNIGGSVSINQTGSTGGNCVLDNTMSAAATASGLTDNDSTSGKQKGGLLQLILIIAILIIGFLIAKSIAGGSQDKEKQRQAMENAMLKAQAGCPGGQKPVLDPRTGKPAIDIQTMRPICPAPTYPYNQPPPTSPNTSQYDKSPSFPGPPSSP